MLVAVGFVDFDDLNRGKNGKTVNVARKIEYPGYITLYILSKNTSISYLLFFESYKLK